VASKGYIQGKWWKISNISVRNNRKGKDCLATIKELLGGSVVSVSGEELPKPLLPPGD